MTLDEPRSFASLWTLDTDSAIREALINLEEATIAASDIDYIFERVDRLAYLNDVSTRAKTFESVHNARQARIFTSLETIDKKSAHDRTIQNHKLTREIISSLGEIAGECRYLADLSRKLIETLDNAAEADAEIQGKADVVVKIIAENTLMELGDVARACAEALKVTDSLAKQLANGDYQ